MTDWVPATEVEVAMRDALRVGDQELYFQLLSRCDLLLPVSGEASGSSAATGWGTWSSGDRTHVLAFTSPQAMAACLAEHAGSARKISYVDLSKTWPNLDWWLAVNPGLPIEGYLPAWFVAQLARGDIRLPGRAGPTRARVERVESFQRARAVASVPRPALPAGSAAAHPPAAHSAVGGPPAPAAPPPPAAQPAAYSAADGPPAGIGQPQVGTSHPAAPPRAGVPLPPVAASGHPQGGGNHQPGTLPPGPVRPAAVPGRAVLPPTGPGGPPTGSTLPSAGPAQAWTGHGAARASAAVGPIGSPRASDPSRLPERPPTGRTGPDEAGWTDTALPRRVSGASGSGAPGSGGSGNRADGMPATGAAPATGPAVAAPAPGQGTPTGPGAAPGSRIGSAAAFPARRTSGPGAPSGGNHAPPQPGPPSQIGPPAQMGPGQNGPAQVGLAGRSPARPDQVDNGDLGHHSAAPGLERSSRGHTGAAWAGQAVSAATPAQVAPPPASPPPVHNAPPQMPSPAPPVGTAASVPAQASYQTTTQPSAPTAAPPPARQTRSGLPVRPTSGGDPGPGSGLPVRPTSGGDPGPGSVPARQASRPGGTHAAPVPDFTPANDVEASLLNAAEGGNTDSFLSTLLLAKVLIPVPPDTPARIRPGDSGFNWLTDTLDDQPYVVVFTSTERLLDHLGEPCDTVTTKFVQLIRHWPDDQWSFAVNPGTPVGAKLPGTQIVALANWADEVGLTGEPSGEVASDAAASTASPAVAPAPAPAGPTMMQKVIPPAQVDYYLDRGYDRVSGFVHRAAEVAHLRRPEDLFAALGLGFAGSPFPLDAAEVHVLRWAAHRPNLYRIPYGGQHEAGMRAMQGWVIERTPFRGNGFAPGESGDIIAEFKVDSARLPHGAQLWRISSDGTETLLGLLDADGPQWRRVDGTEEP